MEKHHESDMASEVGVGSNILKPETHCIIFVCPRQKTGIVKLLWRFM